MILLCVAWMASMLSLFTDGFPRFIGIGVAAVTIVLFIFRGCL
jgi:hypothetical protein